MNNTATLKQIYLVTISKKNYYGKMWRGARLLVADAPDSLNSIFMGSTSVHNYP